MDDMLPHEPPPKDIETDECAAGLECIFWQQQQQDGVEREIVPCLPLMSFVGMFSGK